MVKLLCFAGSERKDSFNKKLAQCAEQLIKEQGAKVAYLDLSDYPMPLYNSDLEADSGLPEAAKKLKKLFREHDGFFIASPEYNSSFSPLLKNTLDWISRSETTDEPPLAAFDGKVAALGAASPGGFGGLRGLVPLRMMLGNIGVLVVPGQVVIPAAHSAFDEEGKLKDNRQHAMLSVAIEQLVRTAKR